MGLGKGGVWTDHIIGKGTQLQRQKNQIIEINKIEGLVLTSETSEGKLEK